jgi:hypothetical protein
MYFKDKISLNNSNPTVNLNSYIGISKYRYLKIVITKIIKLIIFSIIKKTANNEWSLDSILYVIFDKITF